MYPYDHIDTDLRNWRSGGWNASKMTVKVNGRWSYIYNYDSSVPTNVKEPISLNGPYIPPNHRNEPFEATTAPKSHPLRTSALQQRNIISKAPICYINHNYSKIQKEETKLSLQGSRLKSRTKTNSPSLINNQKFTHDYNELTFDQRKEDQLKTEQSMNYNIQVIPFWVNKDNKIKDLRERTALDSRMKKRDQIRLKQIKRAQKKPRPLTSSFSNTDTIIRDDSVLKESQKLSQFSQTIPKRMFYVC
ncbi:hypothetical protein M9Y10_022843 [Tritrichomonas musculus]|uniref:Uncharacterized protein n=1 Tax=Tritrichomonas musculus TaxID=1915356 RepID=A0ABR2KUB8_9EUKA